MEMTSIRWQRGMAVCVFGLMLAMPALAADPPAASTGLSRALEQAWRLRPEAAALEAREAEARASQDIAIGLTPEPGSVSISSRNDRLNRNLGKTGIRSRTVDPLVAAGAKGGARGRGGQPHR
jgi:hypothetical protein